MPPKEQPKVSSKRSKIEWAMWANVLGVQGAFVMFVGGIIGQFDAFPRHFLSIYAIVASVVIFVIEWPRGRRMGKHSSSTMTRSYQDYFTPIVMKLGFLVSNYFVRGVLIVMASVPLFFVLPLVLGGVILVVSGLVYFFAAVRGESWVPCLPRKNDARPKLNEAPKYAPPRLHAANASVATSASASSDRPERATPQLISSSASSSSSSSSKPAAAAAATAGVTRPSVPPASASAITSATSAPPSRAAPVPVKRLVPSMPAPTDAPPAPPKAKVQPKPRQPVTRNNSDFGSEDNFLWQAQVDPSSGQTYYYNSKTNQTQWEAPENVTINRLEPESRA